jgi:DNA polymerase-3 subunit beta
MKLTIPKSHLLLGLQRVQNVVERKTTMPILSNALLVADGSVLTLAATDLEVGIQSYLTAIVKERGSTTVKARGLLDIVRELPEVDMFLETKESNRLEITANRSVFNIVSLPSEDFPEIPVPSNNVSQVVRANGPVMESMLEKTLYATSTDEARYYFNGVYFETLRDDEKPYFRMVATDAHRLALVDHHEAFFDIKALEYFDGGVIVPRKGLLELKRLFSEGKDDFLVAIQDNIFFVKRDNILISMRLVGGKYADYRRIIPESSFNGIIIGRDELLASLKRISLMSSDKSRSVIITLSPNGLQLSSQSPELGTAVEEIITNYQGEEIRIGFNSRYLMDAISTIDSQEVRFEVGNKNSPGVLRATTSFNHTSVVMPMRG